MRAASVFRLETLGLDLLEGILSELTPREAVHARATCRVMRDACRNLERNAREGGRGRRHRCRVVVGCSRSSELVELDGTAFEATGRRAGAWVTTRHPKRPHDAWLTGVALDRASGDIFAAQYQKRGVLRFDANLRYRKILHGVGKRLECPEGVAVARGRVFVATGQGILAVLDQATGEILDRRLAETPDDASGETCVPWGLTVGPDDALYVCVDDSYHGEPPDFYIRPPRCPRCGVVHPTGRVLRVSLAVDDAGEWTGFSETEPPRTYVSGLVRPSGLCFHPDTGDLLVTTLDARVRRFAGPRATFPGERKGIFFAAVPSRTRTSPDGAKAAATTDETNAVDEERSNACEIEMERTKMQPFDVCAPPRQGGTVFVSVHAGNKCERGGVVACDVGGRVLGWIRHERLRGTHPNMMCAE